jgi:hypothetical protein
MDHAHWGLIALAFVLGSVLTFAPMIRRVKREVPVGTSTGAAAAGGAASLAGEAATTKMPKAGEDAATKKMSAPSEAQTMKMPAAGATESKEKPQKDQGQ